MKRKHPNAFVPLLLLLRLPRVVKSHHIQFSPPPSFYVGTGGIYEEKEEEEVVMVERKTKIHVRSLLRDHQFPFLPLLSLPRCIVIHSDSLLLIVPLWPPSQRWWPTPLPPVPLLLYRLQEILHHHHPLLFLLLVQPSHFRLFNVNWKFCFYMDVPLSGWRCPRQGPRRGLLHMEMQRRLGECLWIPRSPRESEPPLLQWRRRQP